MNSRVMHRLVEQVRQIGYEESLWSSGDCIVVAVSGGPDSVALLHILHQLAAEPDLKLQLVCAHVNHGFRGAESDEEAEFVRRMASELGIPFELGVYDIPAYMKESRHGAQLAAREKRYEFLHIVAEKYKANAIALAHHADDQAETVLMRIMRGSGTSGLAGMRMKRREKNVELIRPLLRIYKNDLIQMCEKTGIPYVTDSTNLLPKYARNAVRLDVLPFLGQYNSGLTESLNRLAEVVGAEDDFLQQKAEQVYQELVFDEGGIFSFKIEPFVALHAALQRRLIKLILNYLPLGTEDNDFTKIEAIRKGAIQNLTTTWSLDLGGGLRCMREYDTIRFMLDPTGNSGLPYTYLVKHFPAEISVPNTEHCLRFTRYRANMGSISLDELGDEEAVFDADKLLYPLTVRSRLPGDFMKVIGLNGSKKVKDIFIDAKIPPSSRSQIPMVTDAEGQIIWIPGLRRSEIATVSQHTTSVLRIVLDTRRFN